MSNRNQAGIRTGNREGNRDGYVLLVTCRVILLL